MSADLLHVMHYAKRQTFINKYVSLKVLKTKNKNMNTYAKKKKDFNFITAQHVKHNLFF